MPEVEAQAQPKSPAPYISEIEKRLPLSDLIRRRRKLKDLNQEELGKLAGISGAFVCGIESKKRRPSEDVCVEIAPHLDLPAKELVELLRREKASETVKRTLETSPPSDEKREGELEEFIVEFKSLNQGAQEAVKAIVKLMLQHTSQHGV